MGFEDCMRTALEGGEINRPDHDRLIREYGKARARTLYDNGEAAKAMLLKQLQAETVQKKRLAKLSLLAMTRIAGDLDRFRTPAGKRDMGRAALLMLEHYGEAPFDSVASREKAVAGEAMTRMTMAVERFQRGRLAGDKARMNRAQLPNLVKELFGEESGDAMAKAMASGVSEAMEFLRLRFNAAGGAIAKLENWGLPQRHDPNALRNAGLDAWRKAIQGRLDIGRMQHPLSGNPISAAELDEVLKSVWKSIVTDGMDELEPSTQRLGRGALANQRAEHRFLVFRDAENWLAYQREFGAGDPFASIMEHTRMMARDVAAMEILGPNPNGTIEWLKQQIIRDGAQAVTKTPGSKADEKALEQGARLDEVWGTMRGNFGVPVNAVGARIGGGVRNWISASILGGAALSSLSDVGTGFVARKFSGVGGSVLRDYITALLPSGRQEAIDAGLILEASLNALHQEARYVGAFVGNGLTGYLADRVVSLTGLHAITQAGRHAWGLAFFRETAKQASKSFDQLSPFFRRRFEAYGLGEAQWNTIRSAALHKGNAGLTLIRPKEIAALDPELASRYLGMVQMDAEYAVPSGGYRSRSYLTGGTRPGTVPGELMRGFGQLKSFAGVYAMLHGQRMYMDAMAGRKLTAATYGATLLLVSTFTGGMVLQLKQIAAGKDPQPMTDHRFWVSAMMQGGGVGLYGDFLFADINRFGGGLPNTIAGPAIERGQDLINLTIGNAIQLANGEETKFGKELVQFARGNIPGGNLWYIRLAWERLVLDQAQALLDPEAAKSFRTKRRNLAREKGQGYWWRPGETAPARGPNLGNVARPTDEASMLAAFEE